MPGYEFSQYIQCSGHAKPADCCEQCPDLHKQPDGVNILSTTTRLVCEDRKILVIEDDADIASNTGQYFEDKVHRLDFAYSGTQGLAMALAGGSAWITGIENPRSGWPNPDSPLSVTVAAPTCTEAGILSTMARLAL